MAGLSAAEFPFWEHGSFFGASRQTFTAGSERGAGSQQIIRVPSIATDTLDKTWVLFYRLNRFEPYTRRHQGIIGPTGSGFQTSPTHREKVGDAS